MGYIAKISHNHIEIGKLAIDQETIEKAITEAKTVINTMYNNNKDIGFIIEKIEPVTIETIILKLDNICDTVMNFQEENEIEEEEETLNEIVDCITNNLHILEK